MGELERIAKKRMRREQLQSTLLKALVAAGAIGLMLAAPNAVRMLKIADPLWEKKRSPRQRLYEVAYRMRCKGLVKWNDVNGKKFLRLTAEGERAALHFQQGIMKLPKPRRWDGKWRLVIFDIRERRRSVRDRARRIISQAGFVRLQDSVWAYPHDCEEIIALLKLDLKIGREMLYIIADAIEFDRPLREHFELPAAR